MTQVANNEVPEYGSDENSVIVTYCECEKPEAKSHQKFVEIDGVKFHVPASGAFLAICRKCDLQIRKESRND